MNSWYIIYTMINQYKERIFTCLGCNKTVAKRRDKDKIKYCSLKCYRESERPQRKTGKTILCENCGISIYKRKCSLGYTHHFCSMKCANEYQGRNKLIFICKICGKEFKWNLSRIKKQNPIYCSIKCRDKDPEWIRNACINGNIIQQNKKELNAIELAGREILNQIGVDFKEQVLIANKFLVDVFIAKHNLIIQWDGDYWHCHPRFQNPDVRQLRRKKIDKSQNAYFKKCSYRVLRFWESDIRREIKGRSDYIRKRIYEVTG